MQRIPRSILLNDETLHSDTTNIQKDFLLADLNPPFQKFSFSSMADIEWLTKVIEPDQQRGPSETP